MHSHGTEANKQMFFFVLRFIFLPSYFNRIFKEAAIEWLEMIVFVLYELCEAHLNAGTNFFRREALDYVPTQYRVSVFRMPYVWSSIYLRQQNLDMTHGSMDVKCMDIIFAANIWWFREILKRVCQVFVCWFNGGSLRWR